MQTSNRNTTMNVGRRITLVACVFTLPIAILFSQVWSSITEFVTFAQKEHAGNAYQRPLEQSLAAVQQLRLALLAGNDAGAAPRLQAAIDCGNAAMESIAQADADFGELLQFTPEGLRKRNRAHLRVPLLRSEWRSAVAAIEAGSIQGALPQLEHLVADLRGYITHAGDTSNLILDPDLDSYYLMDVTLLALPQTQDRIGAIMSSIEAILAQGSPSREALASLAVQAAMLGEADLARVVASTQTCINEDANFYGAQQSMQDVLPRELAAYQQATTAFLELARCVAAGETVDVATARSTGSQALAASFSFWHTAAVELDVLLSTRIAHYESRRTWMVSLSALAVLVSCLLGYAVKRSITTPLARISGSLGPGATLLSECATRIADEKAAVEAVERRIIVNELVAHADDMRKAVLALSVLVGTDQEAETLSGRTNA